MRIDDLVTGAASRHSVVTRAAGAVAGAAALRAAFGTDA